MTVQLMKGVHLAISFQDFGQILDRIYVFQKCVCLAKRSCNKVAQYIMRCEMMGSPLLAHTRLSGQFCDTKSMGN
jgi:hypothetical protein